VSDQSYWDKRMRRRSVLISGGAATFLAACSGGSSNNGSGGNSSKSAPAAAPSSAAATTSAPATAGAGGASSAATAAAATTQQGQPKRGGTLKMEDINTTDVYDPAITIAAQDMFKGFVCYDYMTKLNTLDLKVEPQMANMPEQVDELTYVYKIKPGIKWQNKAPLNGRPFTAEDAAFGWSRFGLPNPEYTWASKVRAVDKWEPIDAQTLRVTTKEPFAPLVALLSSDIMVMVSREAHEKFGNDGMKRFENLIGTGPFMADQFDQGVHSRVVRNPDYWQQGKPYVDVFDHYEYADAPTREANILTQKVDINSGWGSDGSIQNNKNFGDKIKGLGMSPKPLAAFWHVTLNTTGRVPAFKDARVRRAFQLAANRQANIAAYMGNHWTMGPVPRYVGPIGWPQNQLDALPGYRADKAKDLADAKALLSAAGYGEKGQPINVTFRCGTVTSEVLQQNWQALGNVKVELKPYTTQELLPLRTNADFDIVGGSISAGSEADDFLYGWSHTKGATNYGRFSDPDVDRLAEKQRTLFDFNQRKAVTDELQNLLLDRSPHTYMHSWVFFQYWQPWVKNVQPVTGSQVWIIGDIWLDGKPG
jgi:peptide/nickel transport system substrate-binding protein